MRATIRTSSPADHYHIVRTPYPDSYMQLSIRGCAACSQLQHLSSSSITLAAIASQQYKRISSVVMAAHPPSQFVTDDNGLKWRLCAGAAVFNSKNEM